MALVYNVSGDGSIVLGTPDISYFKIDNTISYDSIIIKFIQSGDLFQNTIINVNGYDIAMSDGIYHGEPKDYRFDDTIPNFAEIYTSLINGPGGGAGDFISSDPTVTEFAYEEYTKKSDGSWVLVNQGSGGSGGSGDVSTGLEAIDEGNGIGWRLVGQDPANYGEIGERSVDFSYSSKPSDLNGATGENSFAIGNGAKASGSSSFTMGFGAAASGDYSTAMGYGTTASGDNSTAMGYGTTASGDYSTAMGKGNTASGAYSSANGENNVSSGKF